MSVSFYMWNAQLDSQATDFSGWLDAQGSTQRTIAFGRDIPLYANTTVPTNIDIVEFYNNAKFSGNYILTINKMSAVPRHQIFDPSVTVRWGSGAVPFVYPEWFGYTNQITTASGNFYFTGSGVFNGQVHALGPTVSSHLTTKYYVDNLSNNFSKSLSLYNPIVIPECKIKIWKNINSISATINSILFWYNGDPSSSLLAKVLNQGQTTLFYNLNNPNSYGYFLPTAASGFINDENLEVEVYNITGLVTEFYCQVEIGKKLV